MSSSSKADLAERLQFMNVDAATCEAIRQIRPIVERELPIALDGFYEQLRATPQVKRFFGTDALIARAKGAQIGHWSSISSATFDSTYTSKVRAIGQTHARIGLEPRWYIGGYALIVEHLIKAVVEELSVKPKRWGQKRVLPQQIGVVLAGLVKAVLLDMDLAISVYIEAAEEARLRSEAAAKEEERALVSKSIGAGLAKLAAKDLTYRVDDALPDAYRTLQEDFNTALEQMEKAIDGVGAGTQTIRSGATEMTTAADDLSRRTEQQAASLEQTAAALDEITATVKRAAESAVHAREVVASAKNDAEMSGAIVRKTVEAMGSIERSSQQINQIIGVIDEIAFQTNLLALNAGVEAARAGEAGRGFAVVASEVRALAQRSAEAAKEIKGLISASSGQVEQGVQLVAETGKSLERIISQVAEINAVVNDIASGAQEQSTGLQQVNMTINQMDQVTQQNAAMVEQSTAASHSLAAESSQLAELVRQFRTRDSIRNTATGRAAQIAAVPAGSAKRHTAAVSPGRKVSAVVRKPDIAAPSEKDWQEF